MTTSAVIVEEWITIVSRLLDPARPGDAIEPLRGLMVFMQGFGREAFTRRTAAEVAEMPRYGKPVPEWGTIAPILREAVRNSRPINAGVLPAPVQPDLTPPTSDELDRIGRMVAACRQIARNAADNMRLAPSKPLPIGQLEGDRLEAARHALRCQRAGIAA